MTLLSDIQDSVSLFKQQLDLVETYATELNDNADTYNILGTINDNLSGISPILEYVLNKRMFNYIIETDYFYLETLDLNLVDWINEDVVIMTNPLEPEKYYIRSNSIINLNDLLDELNTLDITVPFTIDYMYNNYFVSGTTILSKTTIINTVKSFM